MNDTAAQFETGFSAIFCASDTDAAPGGRVLKHFATLALLLASIPAQAENGLPGQVNEEGVTTVAGGSGKLPVVVRIETKAMDKKDPRREAECWDTSSLPCTFVQSIGLTVNRRPVPVPRSAYMDLADLRNVTIEPLKGGGTLTLRGGDASTGYRAVIRFNATRVLKRSLYVEISQDEPAEETVYFDIKMGD